MATHAWRLPAAPASRDQRRVERRAVTVSRATVREHGQPACDATLLDLSIYGCRLAIEGEQEEGGRVWLRLDGGLPIAATVVWVRDGRVGCRFDEAIPGTVMRDLTRALH